MSANWKYRQGIIKNADEIIKLKQSLQCVEQPIYTNTTLSSTVPYLYNSCIDKDKPVGYESSNMKEQFLMKNEIKCSLIAPEILYRKGH